MIVELQYSEACLNNSVTSFSDAAMQVAGAMHTNDIFEG